MASTLVCVLCGATYPLEDRFRCDCSEDSLLEVRHELPTFPAGMVRELRVKLVRGEPRYDGRQSGVWRWKKLVMPDFPDDAIVTQGEGNTRLYEFANVNQALDLPGLLFKHEGENPTGSFKDRGMTVAASVAKLGGARWLACASTGNTAASVASYASAALLESLIIIPESATALGKISQSLAYRALCLKVRGNFDDGLRLLLAAKDELGLYVMNSVNPYRLEGQKTIMFEMLDQLDAWENPPDWVVVPAGNLGNASAFGKAFVEAHAMGLIPRMPRLAFVQAEGASPFYRAFRDGWYAYETMVPDTIATAIRIGAPVNVAKARKALEATNGVVTCATDQEIMDAKALLDGSGVGAEPAACATVAGIQRLRGEGVIHQGDRVVAVLTGHMLKDPDATIGYHSAVSEEGKRSIMVNPPQVIDPVIEDVEREMALILAR